MIVGLIVSIARPSSAAGPDGFTHNQGWLWTYTANIKLGLDNKTCGFDAGFFKYAHFWTLAIEEQFYLVWPLLVRLTPTRRLPLLAVTIAALSTALRMVVVWHGHRYLTAYYFTPLRLEGLLLGSATACWIKSDRFVTALRVWMVPLLIAAAVILVGLYPITRWDIEAPLIASAGFLILPIAFTVLVAGCFVISDNHPIRRVMENRTLQWFGKYSYGLYALHMAVIDSVLSRVSVLSHRFVPSITLSALVGKIAVVLITIAAAWLSYNLYEKQFLRLKRFFEYPPIPVRPA